MFKTISITAFLALSFASSAVAADALAPLGQATAGVTNSTEFDWSGFYAGVNLGHGSGEGQSVFTLGGSDYYGGFLGGVQAGYNFDIAGIVIGIEGDYQFADVKHRRDLGAGVKGAAGFNSFGTIRARVGADMGSFMPYLTGGVAYASMGYNIDTINLSDSDHAWGGAVGAGIEAALTDNISFKAEYLYVHVRGAQVTLAGFSTDFDAFQHAARAGVNFHF